MPITVEPLHPVVAARVTGLDLREPLDDATIAALNDAINRAGVLVYPGQFITDEQQMAFSRRFGDLETTVRAYRTDFVPRLDVHIADISNLDDENRVRTKDDRLRLNALGNRLWHSDSSFKRIPARFSLLSARTIPAEGGETQFADMRAAWDALPDRKKTSLEGLICEHTQLFCPRPHRLHRLVSGGACEDGTGAAGTGPHPSGVKAKIPLPLLARRLHPRHGGSRGSDAADGPDRTCHAATIRLYT